MYKIGILIFIGCLLTSCTDNTEKETVIEEAGRITTEYVDTLEGSITDAKAVRDLMNANNEKLKNNLQIK